MIVIVDFGDKETSALFHGTKSRGRWTAIKKVALRKLDIINAAHHLDDLKNPPGNKLEALKRDLKEYHSIRINDQFRIIFIWSKLGAHKVQIVDYH